MKPLDRDRNTVCLELVHLRLLSLLAFGSIVYFAYELFLGASASFWRDEAFTALLIQNSPSEIIKKMAGENNPPLHPLVLHFLTKAFGVSEWSLRLPSMLAIFLAGFVLRYAIEPEVIRVIFTFLYFSSVPIFYVANEARYYGLFILGCSVSLVFGRKFIERPSLPIGVIYFLGCCLTLYAHSLGIVFFFWMALLVGFEQLGKSLPKNALLNWILTTGLGLLCFLPWLGVLWRQTKELNPETFWVQFDYWISLKEYLISLFCFVVFHLRNLDVVQWIFVVVLGSATISGFFKALSFRGEGPLWSAAAIYLSSITSLYLLSFLKPVFHTKYLLFVFPFLLVVAAFGLFTISIRFLNPIGRTSFLSLVLLGFGYHNFQVFKTYYSRDYNPPFRELKDQVSRLIYPDTAVISHNEFTYFQSRYYFTNAFLLKPYSVVDKTFSLTMFEPERCLNRKDVHGRFTNVLYVYNGPKKAMFPKCFSGYSVFDEYHFSTPFEDLNAVLLRKL